MSLRSSAARLLSTRAGQVAKQPIRRAAARLGYELVPVERDDTVRFRELLVGSGCRTLLDVGANQGQYAERARSLGFPGDVVSFEPGREAYGLLERNSSHDARWAARRVAVGGEPGSLTLNVSRNSVSSSLLPVNATHLEAAPESTVAHTEQVEVVTLDSQTEGLEGPFWLKIDTQGYESQVLAGAVATLARTEVVHVELSLTPLYEQQAHFVDVLATLDAAGFRVVDLEPGLRAQGTSDLLQCDAVLRRRAPAPQER